MFITLLDTESHRIFIWTADIFVGAGSAKPNTPPLKNGNDLRESGYLIAVGSRTSRFRRKYKKRIPFLVIIIIFILLLLAFIIISILYALAIHRKPVRTCRSRECLRSAANLALSMDLNADPCENFYQFVCGNWGSDHPRPDAYRSYDWFRDKQTKVYSIVRDFLNRNSSHQPKPVLQAKDMYRACMNTKELDKRGLKPVITILESLGLPPFPTFINVTEDFDYSAYTFDWLETVIKVKTQIGMDVLIGFDIYTDPKNSSVYRLIMGSPETTNPFPSTHTERKRHRRHFNDLKSYIKEATDFLSKMEHKSSKSDEEDEKVAEILKIFYAELMKLFVLEADGLKSSKLSEIELDQNVILAASEYFETNRDLYDLETDNTTSELESSDDAGYLIIPDYTVDEIQAHTDAVVESNNGTASPIWKKYLEGLFNISNTVLDFETDKILVSEPDLRYMSLMAAYVSKTPPVVLELYIWVKVVEVMSVHTTTELRNLFQRAYEQSHADDSVPPRSLHCANAVNDMMGMAVSYGIADRHFINVTKPKVITMIEELKDSLAHLVGQARWMDDNTKIATYQKIIEMKSLIGFPDWLLEEGKLDEYYEGIEIDSDKHLENLIKINQVKTRNVLNRFRGVNNFSWATDPTEVNAYHTFQENTITVPMVMLQHPFYDLGLDSLNYGSLGTVLGHEITHGFDNFGRQFDKNGNMLPWWSNSTIDSFVNMTQCFVDQYSSYYVPELDDHIDGKQTLGENIADNGGLREALAALKHHLKRRGPEPKLPGFEKLTPEQLFFLSYGNLWCGVSTRDSLKADLEDEHSPQQFRARGALQNSAEFARAWDCPPGSKMNPSKRCIIF
ncbi:endothelin-converting enzyme 2-like isoform X1 [Helicoverpa zea]|uniref:endothelin-converting enzyme 2-like isoform X1 n=2 Tax=Helicoverpa zea TaxID=7113 RepID=UPI001F58EFF5|nr:endothelin-converting enzyme 2-like isoform X1 [Helicoverpa zea]